MTINIIFVHTSSLRLTMSQQFDEAFLFLHFIFSCWNLSQETAENQAKEEKTIKKKASNRVAHACEYHRIKRMKCSENCPMLRKSVSSSGKLKSNISQRKKRIEEKLSQNSSRSKRREMGTSCDYHRRSHKTCPKYCLRSRKIFLEEDEYIVEQIVEHRISSRGMQFRVKWKGYDHRSNTWEPLRSFSRSDGTYTQALEDYIFEHNIVI